MTSSNRFSVFLYFPKKLRSRDFSNDLIDLPGTFSWQTVSPPICISVSHKAAVTYAKLLYFLIRKTFVLRVFD